MSEAVFPPDPPSAWPDKASQPQAGPARLYEFLQARPFSNRESGTPPAAPHQDRLSHDENPVVDPTAGAREPVRHALHPHALRPHGASLEKLRQRVREIERHACPVERAAEPSPSRWRLGTPGVDALLGLAGLDSAGVHEVKPVAGGPVAGAMAANLSFALRLAVRRLREIEASPAHPPRILWCAPAASSHETGLLHGPGLARLGLDPSSLIIVETARQQDVLWAMEEGLRCGSLALVAGILKEVGLTPARRLSLAAEQHRTPCLLMTHPRAPATGATATRWRVGPARSGVHAFDPRAPGDVRFSVTLERCRTAFANPAAAFTLEWSGDAFRPVVETGSTNGAATPHHDRARHPGRALLEKSIGGAA